MESNIPAIASSDRRATDAPATRPRVQIDSIAVDDIGFEGTVETIAGWAREGSGGYVVTTNVDYVVRAHRDPSFRAIIDGARLRVPDGMGVVYGARLAGSPLRGSITGRLLPAALARHPDRLRLALMGGLPGATQPAAQRLRELGGDVRAATSPPMGFAIGGEADQAAVRLLADADPQVLFVGLGSPKQDRWMARHAAALPRTVMVGIGQAIDVLGGRQPVAPAWMTRVGLEWAYRLVHDPRRLARRYLWDDPRFFWWMLRARRK
ncbi:MAG TPA: WecB/TagA/CpsF family glycosyltransferase [Candidatus Limnocylindria bacterium]